MNRCRIVEAAIAYRAAARAVVDSKHADVYERLNARNAAELALFRAIEEGETCAGHSDADASGHSS